LFKVEQYDPKYLKLNPKGGVPTLVHDGKPCRVHPHLRRLHDLISETEFSEMRAHGPKIADKLASIIAEVRRNTPAVMR
jgi:hypothetical protein